MLQLTGLPAQLLRRLSRLAQAARSVAERGGPVLVWASERATDAAADWPITPTGWVWHKPAAGLAVWAVGEVWTAALDWPDPLRAGAEAWRGITQRAVVEGPLRPVAFAAFAFDRVHPESPWEGLPAGVLSVPRLLRVRRGTREYLAASCVVRPEEDPEEASTWEPARHLPQGPVRRDAGQVVRQLPSEADWKAQVRRAEEACRSGLLQKVVLARCVEVATETSPEAVLNSLWDRYPTCTVFAAARQGAVFLGATPELLVRVRGQKVLAHALAGTFPRGRGWEDDRRLAAELQASPKEREEHGWVASHVRQALAPVCTRFWEDGPVVVSFPNVHHLQSTFRGRLAGPVGVLEAGARLHPTPAVAGVPVAAAMDWIRQEEPFCRGWYAGALGWLDSLGAGELVVAIRSALLRGGRAWAFAGCGVVRGSDPDREYRESQLKLAPVLEALGVDATG